jgi:hypothetical protein
LKSYGIQRNSTGILLAKIRFYYDLWFLSIYMTVDEQTGGLSQDIKLFVYYMLGVAFGPGYTLILHGP